MAEIQTAHAYSSGHTMASLSLSISTWKKYLERNGLLIDIAIFLCLSLYYIFLFL